jgi:hypothetical protein
MNNHLELLARVRALREEYGSSLQPPATKAEIDGLIGSAKKSLSYDLPTEYIDFLRVANGLMWNGFQVYAATIVEIVGKKNRHIGGFVETNLQLWEIQENRPFIAFGETGNAEYAFDKRSSQFVELDHPSLDVIGTHPSFNALLCHILELSLM